MWMGSIIKLYLKVYSPFSKSINAYKVEQSIIRNLYSTFSSRLTKAQLPSFVTDQDKRACPLQMLIESVYLLE